jgi:aarF domain-containing kinase
MKMWWSIVLSLFTLECACSFHLPSAAKMHVASGLSMSTVSETSAMMKQMREQLDSNDDAKMIMDALRGSNMNDDDAAVAGLQMRLVDVYGGRELDGQDSGLPYEYDPVALKEFFGKRPLSVLTRIFQVTSVGGGFAIKVAIDKLLGRMSPDLEVQRAGELRDIITSLGPFPIKIGQSLSIRPDILSPRSMVELQVRSDKVDCSLSTQPTISPLLYLFLS